MLLMTFIPFKIRCVICKIFLVHVLRCDLNEVDAEDNNSNSEDHKIEVQPDIVTNQEIAQMISDTTTVFSTF